jgi:DNA-binding MarR family transcriptional regulator
LVVRDQGPVDRRNRQVRLAPVDETRLVALRADIRAMEDDLVAEFTAAERRSLIRLLSHLASD